VSGSVGFRGRGNHSAGRGGSFRGVCGIHWIRGRAIGEVGVWD
jgi:hypothetical protein